MKNSKNVFEVKPTEKKKKRKKTLDLRMTMSGWYVSVEWLNALENGKVTDGKTDYFSYYVHHAIKGACQWYTKFYLTVSTVEKILSAECPKFDHIFNEIKWPKSLKVKKHTRGVDRQDEERTWEDKTCVPKVSWDRQQGCDVWVMAILSFIPLK